jgi:hypothetical protein
LLTPESIKRLQERLLEKESDIAQRMAEYINAEFLDFTALTHVPMSDLGIPEDQYQGRMLPNFPLKIVTHDGNELAQVEYLKWQNGGVIIVTGDFPLDVFFGFRKLGLSRPVSKQHKEKYQISSVLPLSKLGFQNLLSEIQGKSNIQFLSSRPPMVIQKISNEGVSTPIIARLRTPP